MAPRGWHWYWLEAIAIVTTAITPRYQLVQGAKPTAATRASASGPEEAATELAKLELASLVDIARASIVAVVSGVMCSK